MKPFQRFRNMLMLCLFLLALFAPASVSGATIDDLIAQAIFGSIQIITNPGALGEGLLEVFEDVDDFVMSVSITGDMPFITETEVKALAPPGQIGYYPDFKELKTKIGAGKLWVPQAFTDPRRMLSVFSSKGIFGAQTPIDASDPGTFTYEIGLKKFWQLIPPIATDFPPLPPWLYTDDPAVVCPDYPGYYINDLSGEVVRIRSSPTQKMSGIKCQVRIKDRTPPHISWVGKPAWPSKLPDLFFPAPGVTQRATTGDFCRPDSFTYTDNFSAEVWSAFGIGQILDTPNPPTNWQSFETWRWVGSPQTSLSGVPATTSTFIPNECEGKMRYTIFTWDHHGNMNPGEVHLVEDKPEICYGLRDPTTNLGRSYLNAQPFPFQATLPYANIDINQKIDGSEGFVWVVDNDAPNLMIKVENVRDKDSPTAQVLYFPPPSIASFQSSDVSFNTSFARSPVRTTDQLMTAGPNAGYVRLLKLDFNHPKSLVPDLEKGWAWRFGIGTPLGTFDPTYVQKHFRLENYGCSDTDRNGDQIVDPDSFGERNGFGPYAEAFCTIPLVEDVEYEISLYAEDNVKWINTHEQKVLKTGIKTGSLMVHIRNQFPEVNRSIQVDPDRLISDPIRVVFREPIESPPLGADLAAEKHPYVEASVEDSRGNPRRLRVYFWVKDEKTRIRVLERKYRPGE
jgi:hypothetical protein